MTKLSGINITGKAIIGAGESAPAVPVASFIQSATSGVEPFTVQFTDTSTNSPTSWLWDFGDDTTSTEQNPTHIFTGYRNYPYYIRLTAYNAAGESENRGEGEFQVMNLEPPVASFTPTTASGQIPFTVQFTDTSTGSPTGWAWYFAGELGPINDQNPIYTFTQVVEGELVEMIAINAAGSSQNVAIGYITTYE